MEDKVIYLYLKESPLGLKYLGQTTKNPETYSGSGVYWKRHLRAHKLSYWDIKTTILFETTSRKELKERGLYYSTLWDIVESKEWANLCYETGEYSTLGYKLTPEHIEACRKHSTGRKVSKETRKKLSIINKGRVKTQKQRESAANVWKGKKIPEYIKKAAKEATAYKVIHISSGRVYESVKDAADSISIPITTFRKYLQWAQYEYGFKYLDENLNIKAMRRRRKRELKFGKRNKKNISTKSSKYPGVHKDKARNKWVAQIRIGKKRKHLGRFETEREASKAYKLALEEFKINQKTIEL